MNVFTTYNMEFTSISTFNVPVIVDQLIEEIDADDYDELAIPGEFEEFGFYKEAYNEEFLNLIRKFNEKRKTITTICVAALALGKRGILKGRNATTYHLKEGCRQKQLTQSGVSNAGS